MTRNGLAEQNLATGEQVRVSQKTQDFDLGKAPEPVHPVPPAQAGEKRCPPPLQGENPSRTYEAEAAEPSFADNAEPAGRSSSQPKHPRSEHLKTPARLQFSEDEMPPAQNPSVASAQHRAEAAQEKLAKAQDALPRKKKLKKRRVYDEQKGKATHKLSFEKTPLDRGEKRRQLPITARTRSAVKDGTGMAAQGVHSQFHRELYQVEEENVGIKAGHRAEIAAERTLRTGKRAAGKAFRFVRDTPYRRVEKLEKQAVKANVKLSYRKALAENLTDGHRPQLKSNVMSRFLQKQKIKKNYAKTYRKTKQTGHAVQKSGSVLSRAAKAVAGAIQRHPAAAGILAILLLLVFFILSAFSSCSGMASGILSSVVGSSYLGEDADIEAAELAYTQWETDLLMQVRSAETTHRGFDEYRISAGDVGHSPFELMGFLTAVYQDFKFTDIENTLRQIFEQQYQLTFTEETEIRYADPEDENEDGDTEPYEWHSLHVNLATQSFSGLIAPLMNSEQTELFALYGQTKGNRQYLENPFAFNWLPYVSDFYGWRVHPITGEKDCHRGIDIAVASGTEIHAGQDGVVTTAAFDDSYGNYIVLDDGKGLVSKYAHCSELLVSAGQTVKTGDVIAKVGSSGDSTGPHLHLEVLKDGEVLNPLFFAQTGDDGSGNLAPGSPGGPDFGNPGTPMGGGSYAALIAESEKHLGKRYVFGASGPANFDCSSFVCWALDKSGVKPMGRTTAQGLYNLCTPVSAANAQPGDLIFFQGTYSTSSTVTHVGIYAGSGMMIHCGDPIQYVSINTSYWQNHLYAFGRI